jgi:hypothetical protein
VVEIVGVGVAVAVVLLRVVEHQFFELFDLQAEHVIAYLTWMELLQMGLNDGALPQIVLHCYSCWKDETVK